MFKSWLNKSQPAGGNNLTLILFTNDYTPVKGSVAGDFTVATGGGYASKTLTAGNWTVADVGGIPQALYAEQVFTFTGPITTNPQIFGYAILDADGVCISGEKATEPWTPTLNGDHYDITPLIQSSSGTPTA